MKTIAIVAALLLTGMAIPAFGTIEDGLTQWTNPSSGLVYDIPLAGYYCIDYNDDGLCDMDFVNGNPIVYNTTETQPTPQPQIQPRDEPETQIEGSTERPSGGSSDNDDNDNDNNNDANPYCDKLNAEQRSNTNCHDRRDVDSETGIATCNDGTHKKDWRDCKDASGYDYGNDVVYCEGQAVPEGADECYDLNDTEDSGDEDTGGSNPDGEEADQNCGGESCTDDEKEDSWTDEDEGVPLG